MLQFVVLCIPAMATLRQPAAHRGASAAALRAMCMCVLATIAGRVRLGEYARLIPRNSCFGVLVFVFIAKCRCIGMSFLPLEGSCVQSCLCPVRSPTS